MMQRFKKYITLPLIGYIMLTAAIAYTIQSDRNHAADARIELAEQTKAAQVALAAQTKRTQIALAVQTRDTQLSACDRGNDLRKIIQGILLDSERAVATQARKGIISAERAATAKMFYEIQIARLAPTDCKKANPVLTP